MTYWLHALVIYPLAALGALTAIGIALSTIEDARERARVRETFACEVCGLGGWFPVHGLRGVRLCPACVAAVAKYGTKTEAAKR